MTDFHLDSEWRAMSVNRDLNGFEFISTIEHRDYPFYGVQFHPEKNLYEWVRNKNISHTSGAIKSAQYFAQFFVDEARKSTNSFRDAATEDQFVIYNFNVTFTGAAGVPFEQCYLFPADADYPHLKVPATKPTRISTNLRPGENSH
jgi:gamma-glutamyl hydrolase